MGERRGLRRRGGAVLWIAGGAFVCLVGTLMLLTSPAQWTDRRAYEAADPCEGSTDGCYRVVPAVVRRTDVRRRKSDDYLAWLRLEDTSEDTLVELPVPDRVFPALDDGREVFVRVWNGDVVRIEVPGVGAAETEDSPSIVSFEQPVAGFTAAVWGAFAVWVGLTWWRGEEPEARQAGPFGAVGRVLIGLMAGTMAGFVTLVGLDVYSVPAYLAATAVPALGVWLLLRRRVAPRG